MKRTGFLQLLTLIACLLLFTASNLMAQDACEGNFDCDQDVDGTDAAVFKSDFGRSAFKNPCPDCQENPCPNYYEPCVSNEDCDSGCCCNEADVDRCHDQIYCETVMGAQCINSNTSCLTGETRPCGTDVGECEYGVETCTDGVWGNCVGGITPTVEPCDGLDNDCDGIVDEDFSFIDWHGGTSFLGDSCGTGACAGGTVICNVVGDGAECSSNVNASDEICDDNLDNDCDGYTDLNDSDCPVCKNVGQPCTQDFECCSDICDPNNICCVPTNTCESLGYECGNWDDGCGRLLGCPNCDPGFMCEAGFCVPECLNTGEVCTQNADCCNGICDPNDICN